MGKLAGRRAVITGAARGIGAGIARRFAQESASLVLVDRLEAELRETTDELCSQGSNVEMVLLDLSHEDAAEIIHERSSARFSGVDILVNNAALGITGGIEDFDHPTWDLLL